jgi:hypothetical protein
MSQRINPTLTRRARALRSTATPRNAKSGICCRAIGPGSRDSFRSARTSQISPAARQSSSLRSTAGSTRNRNATWYVTNGCGAKAGPYFAYGTATCTRTQLARQKPSWHAPPSASAAPTPNPSLPGRGGPGARSPEPLPNSGTPPHSGDTILICAGAWMWGFPPLPTVPRWPMAPSIQTART